jgi:hypothetical protein
MQNPKKARPERFERLTLKMVYVSIAPICTLGRDEGFGMVEFGQLYA